MKDFFNIEHFRESKLLLILTILILLCVIALDIPLWNVYAFIIMIIQYLLAVAEDKECNWNLSAILITCPFLYLVFLTLVHFI